MTAADIHRRAAKKAAELSAALADTAEPPVVFVNKNLPETVREDSDDFIWTLRQSPHYERRKAILKKYPKIQSLFGPEPLTKWIVLAIALLQLAVAYTMRDLNSYQSWSFWILAYCIGGTVNQALFLAIHELSHNLGFKSIMANKLFSIMVANVPIGFPYSAAFKPYHVDHHRYQSVDGIDTDMPTQFEARLLSNLPGKLFFALFQVLFYALRPVIVQPRPITLLQVFNVVYQFGIDFLLYSFFGPGALIYLWASTLIAGSGIHPCAAHFIAEHYVFIGEEETYSYYGILNWLCFNVGYHNEHHDFPNIPWSRLPALRKLAADYYDHLPYHTSWPLVTWNFVFKPQVGLWNRVKREPLSKMNLQRTDDTVVAESVAEEPDR